MNWAEFKIQEYLRTLDDQLVGDSIKLVDDTRIYESGGLSTSQIHNLIQKTQQAKSITAIRYFIEDEFERSLPREPDKVINAKGQGWKFGWSKDENKVCGRFFYNVMNEGLSKIERYAKAGASMIGYEYTDKIGIMMSRRFITYMGWYISWRFIKGKEKEGI